jgi:hypothetical protein
VVAHAVDFLLGAHSLRGWRHVAQDLLALRLAHPHLKAAIAESQALERLEAAVLAHGAERGVALAPTGGPRVAVQAPTPVQLPTLKVGGVVYKRPSPSLDELLRGAGKLGCLSVLCRYGGVSGSGGKGACMVG